MKNKSSKLTPNDYEFMNSLASAMLQSSPKKIRISIIFWVISLSVLIGWMAFANIDEIVRGSGEVIPRGDNKVVQNLEGGIVQEILTYEGAKVKKGDILLKIDNQKSLSSYESNKGSSLALEAKILRLRAESENKQFVITKKIKKKMPLLIKNEMSLYKSDIQRLDAAIKIVKQQQYQKEREYEENRKRLEILQEDKRLINKEIAIMKPLVEKGIKSEYDFLKLQREKNGIVKELEGVKLSLPRLRSAILEAKTKVDETIYENQIKAKEQLNDTLAKYKSLLANDEALSDQVKRTIVRSPINGVVQKLYVHTVGGVVRPGADLVEIVPSNDSLLVEVKVKPSDIAFIYKGQKAKVKFSAYNFSIYGALDGKVESISPDSIQDDKGVTYFKIRIKTNKSYLQRNKKRLKIIPGMTVNVDIITGKRTVLDYILKPILKTKQYSFSEH
ncbi:HlyD family type I secretion periplasmic adaptor subunit [Sulfurimonas sp.]|uniref:HlyD family type I secretion periplasmic adaptor subunit n=1 Tax=Sulfurimonas sp. TaxID=2022749 RepID=UPI00261CFC13|nr:HlyD family type I secretion periplasmic adaptor subunit [Sulfurimonas sp.]